MSENKFEVYAERLWEWASRRDFPALRDELGTVVRSGFFAWARLYEKLVQWHGVVAWDVLDRVALLFGKRLDRPEEFADFRVEEFFDGRAGIDVLFDWAEAWGFPELAEGSFYLVPNGGRDAWERLMENVSWLSFEGRKAVISRLVGAVNEFRRRAFAKLSVSRKEVGTAS